MNKNETSNGATHAARGIYFLSLTVENVRCFGSEPQTLDLSSQGGNPAQWTLLLGNNGTGKTTLLQLLAGWTQERPPSWTVPPEDIDRGIYDGPRIIFGSVQQRRMVLRYQRANVPNAGRCEAATAWKTLPMRSHGNITALSQSAEFNRSISGFSFEPGQCPLGIGYGVTRQLSRMSIVEEPPSDSTASLYSHDVRLRNPEEWLLELDYSASKPSPIAERQEQRLREVQGILVDLLPDVNDVRITVPSRERPLPSVEFSTPFGWVALDDVAFGYQSLIVWVVDLASRLVDAYPDSPTPLHEAAVVLIDEIDLHLHPSWQRSVMGYLSERFPNVQFIATAHSPLIVQSAPSVNANVAVLRRSGDHVVIDNDTEVVRGWRLDQILASDLYEVSPRAPDVQRWIDERREILAKPKLGRQDKVRLKALEEKIGPLPIGESAEEIRTMNLLRRSAELLEQRAESGT